MSALFEPKNEIGLSILNVGTVLGQGVTDMFAEVANRILISHKGSAVCH